MNYNEIESSSLSGSLKDYRNPLGKNLTNRVQPFFDWQNNRRISGLWPYAKSTTSAPLTACTALSDSGDLIAGVNFASQDYLSLASHSDIKEAAVAAVRDFGVHSAGSAALLGNTRYSLSLERALSSHLDDCQIVLYPTGWSAGFASVQGFIRSDDHVVMDVLAHSCLQEGARAATSNIHYYGHLNVQGVERRLRRIRSNDAKNAILVVTESLFSMHSDVPDLRALRSVCDAYDANLLVDCAHDFGCMGRDGLGHLGDQQMLGGADIIIGSFSKTFASNGGFIAVKPRSAAEYLKYYSATQTFSNALSPVQAAVVLKALEIVTSDEGARRRKQLMRNILRLRAMMCTVGLEPLGDPSPIVPVYIGREDRARLSARRLSEIGAIVNLVEYPAVPRGDARFRVQVMADHTEDDLSRLVELMAHSLGETTTKSPRIPMVASARTAKRQRSSIEASAV